MRRMNGPLSHLNLRRLVFAALLVGSANIREGATSSVDQAIIWLPTGVAIAGLYLLGLRSWWVVAAATLLQRIAIGYGMNLAVPATAGSTLEAVLGVVVLHRLGFRLSLARLRDVAALVAASALAPLGSILFAWVARSLFWEHPPIPFYAGWGAWWRMNALGALTVVPVTLCWLAIPRREFTLRLAGGAAAAVTGLVVVLVSALLVIPTGTTGLLWLNLLLAAVVLSAALYFGMRGATLVGTVSALVVSFATALGHSPFLDLPRAERLLAVQLFELTLLALPLAFAALISERKAFEEQYRQAQKMEAIGKLAGGVAHDFNNLLTVISGYAENIRTATGATGPVREYAGHVIDAAERAAGLTRQLLAYSRQQLLSPRVLELSDVVDRMGGMLRRLIGEDIRLVVEHRSGPCWVRVDPSQIEQVLLNLAVNARDAMRTGGTLTISTTLDTVDEATARARADLTAGPCVLLRVHDTGEGMPTDVMARAFDPFFTTKELGRGTGLGLATVYGIVKQSGGSVWIESAPGQGTTVCVSLPRWEAEEAGIQPPTMPVTSRREAVILVVEDESTVRALVCRTLEQAGHQVIEAVDGAGGLDAAMAHGGDIDLVVTDVVMPVMGGREMASRLLARRPGLRFLFVSGYPDDARAPGELAGSAGDFLAKPFTPGELVARVDELLRGG
jgi:signal transduction histidine kinase/CheY-like chemotaxis protein